jgi:hypothetical protein
LIYFAPDFLADRWRRFFPWTDGAASSIGRKRRTEALTSTNC